MTSKLKVNLINDSGDNNIITSDGSGNLTTQKILYPSVFITSDGTSQSISSGVWTKATIHDTEIWDTDGTWSSNRFTPGVAGKYYAKASIRQATDDFTSPYIMILKNSSSINGSDGTTQQIYRQDVTTAGDTIAVSGGWNLGATDYLEVYFYHTTGSSKNIGGSGTQSYSFFHAYRIGS